MSSSDIDEKSGLQAEATDPGKIFGEIINRFGKVLAWQDKAKDELEGPSTGIEAYDENRFFSGEPLVALVDQARFVSDFIASARTIWPLMSTVFPPQAETLSLLADRLEHDLPWVESCVTAVAHGHADVLEEASCRAGVLPGALLLALRSAWSPVVSAHRVTLLAGIATDLWNRSYCPVCGSEPDMSTLECHPEASDFLISKSGQLWHHCPVCDHRWRYQRMTCPVCENQDHESLWKFTVADRPREYIYACDKCRRYLPCLDMSEDQGRIEFRKAALGLVHLDAIAQNRGYSPVSTAPWTALGMTESIPGPS
ncbi:MAG: formate dehydrogenase accessory protein FdhE [Deltaproteobacteria bacterium]|nr:formate dehydrogenase accessory protein FdhE [Deltaproteobacteria bacterium]